jgi:hypothetical protein
MSVEYRFAGIDVHGDVIGWDHSDDIADFDRDIKSGNWEGVAYVAEIVDCDEDAGRDCCVVRMGGDGRALRAGCWDRSRIDTPNRQFTECNVDCQIF